MSIIGATRILLAASETGSDESIDESHGGLDAPFWIVVIFLVLMTARQLTQDVLVLGAWMFPATPVTPAAVPSVSEPEVPADSINLEGTTVSESTQSGPVLPDVASSTSGFGPPPIVPIFFSRYGEKYHYRNNCTGLGKAIPAGIESRTLCKICDVQRSR
jgi:hypothetical protein